MKANFYSPSDLSSSLLTKPLKKTPNKAKVKLKKEKNNVVKSKKKS